MSSDDPKLPPPRRGARPRRRAGEVQWRVLGCLTALVWAAALVPREAAAQAPPSKQECIDANATGQVLRKEAKLLAARAAYTLCAQASCPAVVARDCDALLRDVEAAMPSIVVLARDASGVDVVDLRVSLDGKVLGDRLDGKAVQLDPGPHHLTAERSGSAPMAQEIIVAEGEHLKRVMFRVDATAPPPTAGPAPVAVVPPEATLPAEPVPDEPSAGGVSPVAWIGFGVGGVALVAGAITGGLTLAKTSSLESDCGGKVCSEAHRDDYDAALALSRVSTVSFALAAVGVGIGIGGLFIDTGPDEAQAPATSASARVELRPGGLLVTGEF